MSYGRKNREHVQGTELPDRLVETGNDQLDYYLSLHVIVVVVVVVVVVVWIRIEFAIVQIRFLILWFVNNAICVSLISDVTTKIILINYCLFTKSLICISYCLLEENTPVITVYS